MTLLYTPATNYSINLATQTIINPNVTTSNVNRRNSF